MINDKRFADNLWTLIAGSKYLDVVKGYAVVSVDEPYKALSRYETPEYRQGRFEPSSGMRTGS